MFERDAFRNLKPEEEEEFNKFMLKVKHQAKQCSFGKTKTEAF